MGIAQALSILGAGLGGLSAGEENARRLQRQQEEDAYRRETRDRTRTQWQRDDAAYTEAQADKEAERQAMAPTVVQPDLAPDQMGPAGFNAGVKTFANPDQAKAAATIYNSPAAGMRRAAGAVRNPTRAADLQARADQAELGAMNLDATKQAQESQAWDRQAQAAIVGTGGKAATPEAIAQWLTVSGADGMDGKSKWSAKAGNGTFTLYPVGPDGAALNAGFTKPDTLEGRLELFHMLSRSTPVSAKLADLRAQQKAAADAEDKKADNARADRAQAATERYQQGMLGVHQAELGIKRDALSARGAGGSGGESEAPAWDDKASTFLRQKFTVTDPISGTISVDGAGLQFGKTMALAFARGNGGDLDRAIGGAFDVDARLRADATDANGKYNQAKHNSLRQHAIQLLKTPHGQTGTPQMDAALADMRNSGVLTAQVNLGGKRGTLNALGRFTPEQQTQKVPQERTGMAAAAKSGDPLMGMSRQQARTKRAELVDELKRWQDSPNAQARAAEIRAQIERIDNGQY